MKLIIIINGLAALFSSCAPNFKIAYKTNDIQTNQDQKLSVITLDIEEFTDKRMVDSGNRILFTNAALCKVDGKKLAINSERNYKKSSVNGQITNMLVSHLNQRNTFSKVLKNKKDSADYYITGNLTKFYGVQDYYYYDALWLGVLGTPTGSYTRGKIIIEITDLKIYNKNNELVKDIGTFKREYNGEFPNGGVWSCVFMNTNDKLKEYFSDLIATLETEMDSI